VKTLFNKAWGLLAPFHEPYARFLAGVAARQILVVAGGYSLVWLLHTCMGQATMPIWVFIAGLLLYDAGLLRLDLLLNISFVSRVSFPMFAYLRSKALGKVFQMSLEWHNRQQSGALVGKVNDGVGKVVQTAEGFSRELCPQLIRTVLTLVPLLYFSPWTVAFVVVAVILFAVATIEESRERQPFRKSRHENYARDFGMFSECVEHVQPVTHFGQTDRILDEYGQLQQRIASEGIEEIRIASRWGWKRTMLLTIAKRSCQGIWIWQFRAGSLDAAMVMYMNALIEDLFNSFYGYAGLLERIYDGIEPARTLVNLMGEQPAIGSSTGRAVLVSDMVGIEMRNVQFGFANGSPVLRNLSVSVEPGTVLGIAGRSGIGKTTIQHLLSRTYDVQHGQILISGVDIREWPLEQLRGMFSSVSQNGGVFFSNLTIEDTIRFARPEASRREVLEAARCACIHSEILAMPQGYDTKVGQRGVTISKGQQQRIALAQALLAFNDGRKILILDEFTSALDSKTEEQVLKNVAPLLKGRTVIIIAHRLATLRRVAQKIIVLDDNGIAEVGGHLELIRKGGPYAEMAKLQATA
jgi:ABC-type multidrug transport system fused ATPase/permease subunit